MRFGKFNAFPMITMEGLNIILYHWKDKGTCGGRCLQVNRISLKMVMTDERKATDSLSVSGRDSIILGLRTYGRCH
ncbi:hypothetical protein DPMN_134328 [Dreissena polymorpha]|uniref:Uncharacterized protein n=1 Tax=Dreissena polymorpha TaxID=45954 RepID=A0A9D4FW15_DREPO|nr:hypothetical protein DPMN_134328 [Dreissena polymorpha]